MADTNVVEICDDGPTTIIVTSSREERRREWKEKIQREAAEERQSLRKAKKDKRSWARRRTRKEKRWEMEQGREEELEERQDKAFKELKAALKTFGKKGRGRAGRGQTLHAQEVVSALQKARRQMMAAGCDLLHTQRWLDNAVGAAVKMARLDKQHLGLVHTACVATAVLRPTAEPVMRRKARAAGRKKATGDKIPPLVSL
jgi:hypothetical protein